MIKRYKLYNNWKKISNNSSVIVNHAYRKTQPGHQVWFGDRKGKEKVVYERRPY